MIPILFKPNKQKGLIKRGLIADFDIYRDMYGRNILPVGSEDFVTGWSRWTGATWDAGTTGPESGYPDPDGGNNAYRLRLTGSIAKRIYYIIGVTALTGTAGAKIKCKVLNGKIAMTQPNASGGIYDLFTTDEKWHYLESNATLNNVNYIVGLASENIGDSIDVLVYQPQTNFGVLFPYSPPAGLPQTIGDYSGSNNYCINGSSTGVDANDAAFTSNSLRFDGVDDYCKSSSSAFDDMSQFTCITVLNAETLGGNNAGRIWDKGNRKMYLASSNGDKIFYVQTLSDGDKYWYCPITLNALQIVFMSYNAVTPTITPNIWINNTKPTISISGTASGTVLSDASNDMILGNASAAIRGFDGQFYRQLWYNRILSDQEYLHNYNVLVRQMAQRGVAI